MDLMANVASVALPNGMALYMLGWGDYERSNEGPFLGSATLDFKALAELYRNERYAEKEAAGEDECWLNETDFCTWLTEKEYLSPVTTKSVELYISSTDGKQYVPKHWPECPECRPGRGKKDYGRCRESLNRIEVFYRCSNCSTTWGHHDEPNDEKKPMLEDDGRDTEGGCVPFSISKTCGIAFSTVLEVCRRYGWDSQGMNTGEAAKAMKSLGFTLVNVPLPGTGSKRKHTLRAVVAALHPGRTYILEVKSHWLSYVRGELVDNDRPTGLSTHVHYLYEVHRDFEPSPSGSL